MRYRLKKLLTIFVTFLIDNGLIGVAYTARIKFPVRLLCVNPQALGCPGPLRAQR